MMQVYTEKNKQLKFPKEGKRYGELTILSRLGRRSGFIWWACSCSCGKELAVISHKLREGSAKDCGCRVKPVRETKSSLKEVWLRMLERCNSPKHIGYKNYGGRGIKVSEDWLTFENFERDMGPSNGLTLERIDTNLGYNKDNCKWDTFLAQTRNRRCTITLTYNNHTKPLSEWAQITGIPNQILINRKKKLNYSDFDCLTKPIRTKKEIHTLTMKNLESYQPNA